jgi:phosphatidylglycerophosphate synthase
MTEGERWTRDLLAALRSARYRPAAWRVFLARSFERAANTRTARLHEHRQLVAFEALGLAAWAAVALAGPWLALAGAVWLTLLLLMVDWHLGMLEDDEGRPLDGLGAANVLSILRGAIAPALLISSPAALAALLVAAGSSDAIDGPLARARGETSRLGRWLDGGVDACLLGVAAVAAARLGLLPWWAAGLVLARHAVQWSALALAYFARAEPPARGGVVSGKTPGLVLFGGLVLAVLRVPGAPALVVVGALGGLATFILTALHSVRAQAAAG